MATLSGQTIANRYTSLLKTASDSTLSATLTAVEDGAGNDSDLSIATDKVKVATTLGIGVTPAVGKLQINAGSSQAITVDNGNASFLVGKGSQYAFCIGDCNPVATVGGGTSSTAIQANENYISSNPAANSNSGAVIIMNGASAGSGAIGIGQDTVSTGFIHFGDADKKFKFESRNLAQAFDIHANSETLFSVNGSNKRIGLGENVTDPSNTLEIRETGTAKTNTDILAITNKTNAADMDGTTGSILFNQYYYDASTPAVETAARISAGAELDWTSDASTRDAYLSFSTTENGSDPAERMRITSNGYVGINSTSPSSALYVTGDITCTGSVTAANVISPSDKYKLEEYFYQKPGINADLANTSEATRVIANRNFEIQGDGNTSALCTFDSQRTGILLTTDTTDNDEMFIMPHTDSNQSAWYNIGWGTDDEVVWECAVTLHGTAATAKNTVRYVAGLGGDAAMDGHDSSYLDAEHNHSQFVDAAYFYYDSDNSAATDMLRYQSTTTTWHFVYNVNGTDYVTNLGVLVTEGNTYKFKIEIASDRTVKAYINGVQYGLTTISGVGDTGVNVNGAVSLSSGSSHVITVDGTDATTQIVVGDIITNSTGVAWGTVTAVTSSTSITITAAATKSFPDDSDIYIYGRVAATTTTSGSALHTGRHFVPQIGVTTRTSAARYLTVHYQKINRNLV